MRHILTIFLTVLSLFSVGSSAETIDALSTRALEKRLEVNEETLKTLSALSLNSGVAPLGYRSNPYKKPDVPQWVEISTFMDNVVDLIVIVPTIWRDETGNFQADAFPKSLKITGWNSGYEEEHVLYDLKDSTSVLPRYAPLCIPLENPLPLSRIRIEALELSPRAVNGEYVFQLAEVFIFSGFRNVALRQKVLTSDPELPSKGWNRKYLVDGITPYLMNAATGEKSRPYINDVNFQETPLIDIDLGASYPIHGIRFHAVDQGDTVPQTYPGDFGMPSNFKLFTASDETFSDLELIFDAHLDTQNNSAPVVQWNFGVKQLQHIRIQAGKLYQQVIDNNRIMRIGFSEIELLSNGKNILKGKSITPNFPPSLSEIAKEQLIDGRNFYGDILPPRQWLLELGQRHALTLEQAKIRDLLNMSYQKQQNLLRGSTFFILALLFLIPLLFLFHRLQRVKQETLIRERIASNLHDELGANLHAIGHLGELAQESLDDPEDLKDVVKKIHTLTRETGNAARDCSHMLKNVDIYDELSEEIKRLADRLLNDLNYSVTINGEEALKALPKRTRVDLFLFIKEGMINIIRHSQAQNADITLQAKTHPFHTQVTLDLKDDGIGIGEKVPQSLKRRGKFMRTSVKNMITKEKSGTHLSLRLSKARFFGKEAKL